jgi:uncharacterized protein YdeI (YjbR/CyaY-like superfamily)
MQKALENQNKGLHWVSPKVKPKEIQIPQDLMTALKADEKLNMAFYGLSFSIQKEFADFITQAQQKHTIQSGLKKNRSSYFQRTRPQ